VPSEEQDDASFDSDRIHALASQSIMCNSFNPDFWAINAIFVLIFPAAREYLYMSLETACRKSLTRSGFAVYSFLSTSLPSATSNADTVTLRDWLRPCRNSFYHHLHAEALPALHIERLIGTLYLRSVVEAVEQAGEGHVSLYLSETSLAPTKGWIAIGTS